MDLLKINFELTKWKGDPSMIKDPPVADLQVFKCAHLLYKNATDLAKISWSVLLCTGVLIEVEDSLSRFLMK